MGVPSLISNIYAFVSPIIDVAVLAFIIYKAYNILMKTNGIQIIKVAVVLGFTYTIADFLKLETLRWLLDTIGPGVVITVFSIVFQPELRKLFLKMGQTKWFSDGSNTDGSCIEIVLEAASVLSKKRRGMLVVFLRGSKMGDVLESGVTINSDVTAALLVTIFGHDTPLHDGACVIQGNQLVAAGCFSNRLSERSDIKKTFGSRHRAALGLSEAADCVVLVVSEETGAISLAYESNLDYDLSMEELIKILNNLLNVSSQKQQKVEADETT